MHTIGPSWILGQPAIFWWLLPQYSNDSPPVSRSKLVSLMVTLFPPLKYASLISLPYLPQLGRLIFYLASPSIRSYRSQNCATPGVPLFLTRSAATFLKMGATFSQHTSVSPQDSGCSPYTPPQRLCRRKLHRHTVWPTPSPLPARAPTWPSIITNVCAHHHKVHSLRPSPMGN